MEVKALILDADGVLTQPLKFAEYLQREYPGIADQSREFFGGVFRECIVGKADLRTVLPPYLKKWAWPHSFNDFLNRWFEEEKGVDDRLISVVHAVRESGVPCYVATNQEWYRIQYMRTQMGFDRFFNAVFSSHGIGFSKPDANFYRSVMESIGLPGENILFWDDTQRNVDGARECDWNAEKYVSFEDFIGRLRQILDIEHLSQF